eukprot:CAMPEP_0185027374 /NCGR_PEP_ID=MMETSP1103-20130426/12346_1 /TAXON_ID=36769 /ORGANISM="Paraphysomonas bandaiensis, Strain Caron Lab Isolate" /LENGTH=1041 /DNA_ID=CAMNT_0027561333 /DNA_START=105 /DNA_END=3227 /DNA_ORIENTATION=+
MLALPIKRTNQYDLSSNLIDFLKKECTDDEVNKLTQDVNTLQQLRNNICGAHATSGESGLQQLMIYHHHMKSVSKRLSGYESETKFRFTWTDAFRPSIRCVSGSLYFDWACVLWNIASLESNMGSILDRGSDEGVRAASLHYQQAAGVIEFMRTEVTPKIIGSKSPEFVENFLQMAVSLLLAQAQVCFYEKAVRERKTGTMKPAIIAKLASQVGTFYEKAAHTCKERDVASTIDPSWTHHMEFQRDSFRGVSEYWQSIAAKEVALSRATGYGEEITRLRRAESIVHQAVQVGTQKKLGRQVLSMAESVLATIQRARVSAEKDNSTVYHDTIPDLSSLSPIVPVPMVKALPMSALSTDEKPLFAGLLSKNVRELEAAYRQRADELLRNITAAATNATNEGRSSLSAIGLPGSLEVYKTGGVLPDNMWKKVQQVQSMGGLNELKRKYEDLEGLAKRARNTIDGIENSIKREENADRSFRQRYPDCTYTPSDRLNAEIANTTRLMLQAFESARNSDSVIAKHLRDAQFLEHMRMMGLSRSEITDLLPRASSPATASRCDTSKLERLLIRIADLFQARSDALQALQDQVSADVSDTFMDLYNKYIGTGVGGANAEMGLPEDTKNSIVSAQMAQLEKYVEDVNNTLVEQKEILQNVHEENILFTNARENDPTTLEREKVMKSLEQGMSAYFAMQSQLNAGCTFYRDMQSRLTSLMQQCDDLSYTQQLQRQEYEADRMRAQDRMSQEMKDHELAVQLAEEMKRGANISAPPVQSAPQNSAYEGFQPAGKQEAPNPYNVVYGQPVNGPPSGSAVRTSGSAPFNPNTNQSGQQPSQSSQSYVYNAGFGSERNQFPQQGQSQGLGSNPPSMHMGVGGSAPYEKQFGSQLQHQSSPYYFGNQSTSQQYGHQPMSQQYGNQPMSQQYGNQSMPQQYGNQPTSQQQHGNQSMSPINQSYPSLPGPLPPQHNQQVPSGPGGPGTITEEKINRLVEMGFRRDIVVQVLNSVNGSEEAAVSELLNCSPPPPPASQESDQGKPAQQSQSSGMFSKFW